MLVSMSCHVFLFLYTWKLNNNVRLFYLVFRFLYVNLSGVAEL